MANLLCSSKCADAGILPPKSFEILCSTANRKKGGFRYVAFVDDTVVIPAADDITAWCALAASGNIAISPCGKVDFGTPSFTTTSDDNNCGETTVLETIFTPTFSTYSADPDGLSHCAYYEALVENDCLRAIFFDCEGNPYVTKEYRDFINGNGPAPTGNPGYAFTLTQTPYPTIGDGNFEVWNFQMEIKLDGKQVFCPVILPGLQDCLLDELEVAA